MHRRRHATFARGDNLEVNHGAAVYLHNVHDLQRLQGTPGQSDHVQRERNDNACGVYAHARTRVFRRCTVSASSTHNMPLSARK